MPRGQLNAVLDFIHRLADDGPSDSRLLERFACQRDEDAFACLIRRHGPMVLSLCRRVLHHAQDAEDVFQATFLVLARKAASIRKREALGSWLYGVALRLALQARADAARRPVHQSQLVDVPVRDPPPEVVWHDLRRVLDEEINQLPGKYRQAFVLCHLQGKTNPQAAQELGCPVGTILSRLARARELLRRRLGRRGVTLATGLLVTALAEHATAAAVPDAYVERTMKAALGFATGNGAAAGVVSAHAVTLAEGVLQAMSMTHIRIATAVLLLVGMVGTGVYSRQLPPAKSPDPSNQAAPGDLKGASPFHRQTEKAYPDADKEALRLANKLLQEEVEDEKAKLEALQKKLERLKRSGIRPAPEDPQMAELQRENRRLQRELKRLQEEVNLAEEEVQPYVQALQKGAGKELPLPLLRGKGAPVK
jgi:RNA polymerase sigma factor (sigma-70 family)